MSIQDIWEKAVKSTKILKCRVSALSTTSNTNVKYIFISPSRIDCRDTLIREGKVIVEKPLLILPKDLPQFFGFEFDELDIPESLLNTFLLIRGIRFPSLKYINRSERIEVVEKPLEEVEKEILNNLLRMEDTEKGVIRGEADLWSFSVLIYLINLLNRNIPKDIQDLLRDFEND